MKFLYSKTSVVLFILVLASLWFSACSKNDDSKDKSHEGHAHAEDGHDGDHDEKKAGEDEHEEGHEGHEHEENEAPDLDRPVSELFEENCEHNMKAHVCDECRYEVGVVKVHKELVDDGLVNTVKAEKKAVAFPLRLTGEIQFDDRRVTHVSTQVSGVIRKVHVTLGETVTEGQPLLEIESVEIGNAKAVFQEAQALKRLAQQNFDRIGKLQKEGIASQKEALLSQQELEAAKIRVTAARGVLKRIGMGASKKRGVNPSNSSGRLVLRAGSNGTVLEMHAVSGEVATTDESVVTIGENSTLWVWADLYEKNYAIVSESQAMGPLDAEISVKAFPNRKFLGTVDYISPAMSEVSRTVKVRVVVPNPDGKLLAGMFADVDIFVPGNKEATYLPTSAVLRDEGRSFVFVHHKEDYYVRRPVQIGQKFGKQMVIEGGLSEADLVIANGAFLLKSDVLRSKMGAGCAH